MSSQGTRKRRNITPRTESLEEKNLLSAGMGNTFAIEPGVISKAGATSTLKFTINPSEFKAGKDGKIVIGIDVAAASGSSASPQIVSVSSGKGQRLAMTHARYSKNLVKTNSLTSSTSSAITTTIQVPKEGQKPITYTLQIKGANKSTGNFLVGFYLPGDTNGDGIVNSTDISTITKNIGSNSSSSTYSFDDDSNRDGKVSIDDMKMALKNLDAKVTISPIVQVNLAPASDSGLQDRITNIRNVTLTGSASPNASLTFVEVNGKSPTVTTKTDANGNFSVQTTLGDGSNTYSVTSTDSFGQSISGNIAAITYSTTAPSA